jgi:tight adherence protein C
MELFVVLVFCAVAALALAATGSLSGQRGVKRRLARLADGSAVPVSISDPASERFGGDRTHWALKLLAPFAAHATKGASASRARRRLIEAGYRRESALTIYVTARLLLALLLPFLALIASPAWNVSELKLVVILCGTAGAGLVLPSYWLDRARNARQMSIILGLPDALDLMVVCVEAGLGINASLARVAREFGRSNPVLSAEFELVTLEIRAGKSSTDALRSLAERTGVSEVASLVAMLVQTERFGTSVADTLRVHAESLRVQRLLRAEEQAAKAPLKMMFPTLIIFIATLVVTIGPGLLKMFAFFGEKTG